MAGREKMEKRLRSIGEPAVPTEGKTMIEKWDNALKKFSNLIEEDYKENRESREDFEEKLEILKEIETYLAKEVFAKKINGVRYKLKAVVPFGSSASGLGMKDGDLDMIVCVDPPLDRKRKKLIHERSNDILKVIFKHIQTMFAKRDVEEMKHIAAARVPIITGFVDGIEIDISISIADLVSAQYLASKFIDAYGKYDRQFLLLAAFVKKWQKSKNTDENEDYFKRVFPNSCSTVLLVIFFMKQYGLLPNINTLHEDKLGQNYITWKQVNQGENGAFGVPNEDVKLWKAKHSYEVNVGTLFLLFLDFYGNCIDLRLQKLNIGDGTILMKEKIRRGRVVIIDVIDQDNPAKSVVEPVKYQEMLREAVNIVRKTENSKGLKDQVLSTELIEPTMTKQRLGELRNMGLLPRNFH